MGQELEQACRSALSMISAAQGQHRYHREQAFDQLRQRAGAPGERRWTAMDWPPLLADPVSRHRHQQRRYDATMRLLHAQELPRQLRDELVAPCGREAHQSSASAPPQPCLISLASHRHGPTS
jgi:hypothetical protein